MEAKNRAMVFLEFRDTSSAVGSPNAIETTIRSDSCGWSLTIRHKSSIRPEATHRIIFVMWALQLDIAFVVYPLRPWQIVPEFIIKGGLVKSKIRINNVSSHCTSCARVETLEGRNGIVGINSSP